MLRSLHLLFNKLIYRIDARSDRTDHLMYIYCFCEAYVSVWTFYFRSNDSPTAWEIDVSYMQAAILFRRFEIYYRKTLRHREDLSWTNRTIYTPCFRDNKNLCFMHVNKYSNRYVFAFLLVSGSCQLSPILLYSCSFFNETMGVSKNQSLWETASHYHSNYKTPK